jgi:16S rRNA (uracil1498-N3)-methyltransferase
MARRRFFVDEVRNGWAAIRGDEAHHLTRVLRVEPGQRFEITDSKRVWLAQVESARKMLVEFAVLEELEPEPELAAVVLYLALIRFDRFEWAVEKATELGVSRIVPLAAERSERGLAEGARKRVERWKRIAREASEQSRRVRAPEIADPQSLAEALKDESRLRIWLDERPGAPLLQSTFENTPGEGTALAIGPEGGWTDSERVAFVTAQWAAASLGPFILRAETAACAALAITSQMWLSTRPSSQE